MDLQVLKDELTTDPLSIYLPLVEANDVANADIINTTIRTINNETVDTALIRSAITFEAFDGLVAAEQAWFEWLTSGGEITVNAHTLKKLAGVPVATDAIWAAADRDISNAAMLALMQYTGSRAEELGFGIVQPVDVRNARLL